MSVIILVILDRFKHPRIVGILSGFMNVILFFPSGAIYPIASFTQRLKTFAKVNPEAYAITALKSKLFKGLSLGGVSAEIAFLLLFTAATLVLAIVTFKRTL